jgi:hypothetical protein
MEIENAALISLFIAMGWCLIRVVEFFIKKYGKNDSTKDDKQIKCLENIENMVKHLENVHNVLDDNNIPKWYIPREILPIVKETLSIIYKLKEDLVRVSNDQHVSIEKMVDLISSQKLVTERLGDLILLWTKNLKD